MPPLYSPQLLTSIKRTVTEERLRRYLRATGRDMAKALQLYEYNVQLSEVLYGLVHGLEVAVRNAEHFALTASYGTPAWYDAAPLSNHWRVQLAAAKAKKGAAGNPGKIVAELSFGFWVDLLKNQLYYDLWMRRKLHSAFPNAPHPEWLSITVSKPFSYCETVFPIMSRCSLRATSFITAMSC